MEIKNHLQKFIEIATAGGASDARFFWPKELVIEDALASMCNASQCCNYGHSASCPPHVEGPEALRGWRNLAESALAIRIDVPLSILHSEERYEVMKLLHEVVAEVELNAISLNYPGSRGFAGGSCKQIFCREHSECLRLSGRGICRNPLRARPSMSGYGVNVGMMMKAAGWETCKPLSKEDDSEEVSWVAGLVLISR